MPSIHVNLEQDSEPQKEIAPGLKLNIDFGMDDEIHRTESAPQIGRFQRPLAHSMAVNSRPSARYQGDEESDDEPPGFDRLAAVLEEQEREIEEKADKEKKSHTFKAKRTPLIPTYSDPIPESQLNLSKAKSNAHELENYSKRQLIQLIRESQIKLNRPNTSSKVDIGFLFASPLVFRDGAGLKSIAPLNFMREAKAIKESIRKTSKATKFISLVATEENFD